MSTLVTVTESVFVRCTPEVLWDYTQDFARRREWDASVREVHVLATQPVPRVRVHSAGGVRAVFQYKQFERPVRTSLALEDVESVWIEGGGGSWSYERHADGTLWTQTNSLRIRAGFWRALFVPWIRGQLRTSTRKAMLRAKQHVEARGG